MPRHHIVFYVRVAQPVLIGYGVSVLWSWAWQWIDRSRRSAKARATLAGEPAKWVAMVGGALVVALAALPAQARRAGPQRTGLIHDSTVQTGLDAYRWMRSSPAARRRRAGNR